MLDKLSKYMLGSGENNVGGLTPWENVGALQRFGMGLGGADVVGDYQESVSKARKAEEVRRAREAQQSKLAELAASQDPSAMQQYGASQSPEGLAKYAEFLNTQKEPVAPLTSGLPEGYMWDGNKAVRISGIEEAAPDPLSPEGKLTADYRAGLVDEDLYKAKMKKPSKAASFKDTQLKASSFGNRMIESAKLFNPIESELGYGVINKVAESIEAQPVWMDMFGRSAKANTVRSPQQQQYKGAASEWIRAKLRKESGAVIAAEEMNQEYRTYFPVVGDSPERIKQKTKLRATATDSMIKESAGAYEELYGKELKAKNQSDKELLKALGL